MPEHPIPIVIGGRVATEHIVGRDALVDDVVGALTRGESVLLTGERRIGKTCVVDLVRSRLPRGWACVYVDAERCDSLGSLVMALVQRLQDVTKVRRLARQLRDLLALWRASSLPPDDRQWEQRLDDAVRAVLASSERLVLAIDELPTVLRTVAERDRAAAVHLMRVLRASREEHARRCVHLFSGSIGFHHVLAGDAEITAAVNNLRKLPVTAIEPIWATHLAAGLLRGIGVGAAAGGLADAIARLSDGVPYYEHHLAALVQDEAARREVPHPGRLLDLRDRALRAGDDPWHMQHYVDRIRDNFGLDGPIARAVLDEVSQEPDGLEVDKLVSVVQAKLGGDLAARATEESTRGILDRLSLDHYVVDEGARVRFVYEIVRLGWRARRHLWP